MKYSLSNHQTEIPYKFKKTIYSKIWRDHPSFSSNPQFQQLEFFGDKIISYSLSLLLMEEKRSANKMSLNIASNCSTKIMAKIFQPYIYLINYTGKITDSMLADVLEVFIACVHLDGGLSAAQQVIKELWLRERQIPKIPSSKNLLQEHPKVIQRNIIYKFNKPKTKKDLFICTVIINNKESTQGKGSSKKKASINAAANMLKLIQLNLN